jgi:hypothetical protein
MKSARALKEAADIMSESPAAIQLRYLQVLYFFVLSLFIAKDLSKSH